MDGYGYYKPYEIENAQLGDVIVERIIKIKDDGDIVTKKEVLRMPKGKKK